jgi:pimeloyl-ACP methyl ester carboxylesterase
MEQKYLETNSVRLSYLEKNPDAAITIFFLHGNSNSGYLWHHQYSDSAFDEYRLVVFDLPGHGASSGIPSGDYSLPNMAGIITEGVNTLTNGKAYGLVGLSLGGNIISEMLAHGIAPDALVFLSAGLVGEGITPGDVVKSDLVGEALFSAKPSREKVNDYFNKLPYVTDTEFISTLLNNYHNTDKNFRISFFETVGKGLYSDEISLIRKWRQSPLIAYGLHDDVVNPDLLDQITLPYWGGQIFKIEHAAHLLNWDQPIVMNKLMLKYFKDSFQT